MAGVGLTLAHLQEGLPPNLPKGLLVAGIFISVEVVATLMGFAALGGYLGLRPSMKATGPRALVSLLLLLAGCSMQPEFPVIGAAARARTPSFEADTFTKRCGGATSRSRDSREPGPPY